MMYKFIQTGLRHPNNTDMVFVAMYAAKAKPYRHYTQIPKSERGKNIPLVMMMLRWDGSIGFPGGKVDPGEDLITAVKREAKEEINYILNVDQIVPLCSLATNNDDRHIHCFEYEVTELGMLSAIKAALDAEHFLAECQGCFAVQVAHFEGGGGITEFLQNNFKATAKMELLHMIKKHDWVPLSAG